MTSYYELAIADPDFAYIDMLLVSGHASPVTSGYAQPSPWVGESARRFSPAGTVGGLVLPRQASTVLAGAGAITICFWYNADANSGLQSLIRLMHSDGNSAALRWLMNGTSIGIGGSSRAADSFQAAANQTAGTAGQWHFLSASINFPAARIRTKINSGTLVETGSLTFGQATLASDPYPICVAIQHQTGVIPTSPLTGGICGLALFTGEKDNTFLESLRTVTLGVPTTTVGTNTASFTIDLKTFVTEAAAASETGIDVVVLDAATGAAVTRVLHVVSGESSDGSGQLVVSLPNSLLNNGDIVLVGLTNTNGTPGTMSKQHFYPVQVTV